MTKPDLSFDQYQKLARTTAIYPYRRDSLAGGNLMYPALGLAGEAGEVCEKVKKLIRDQDIICGHASDHGYLTDDLTDEQRAPLVKELGDVLWYCAALASELGVSLADVAQANYDKLKARADANKLQGSGDDR